LSCEGQTPHDPAAPRKPHRHEDHCKRMNGRWLQKAAGRGFKPLPGQLIAIRGINALNTADEIVVY